MSDNFSFIGDNTAAGESFALSNASLGTNSGDRGGEDGTESRRDEEVVVVTPFKDEGDDLVVDVEEGVEKDGDEAALELVEEEGDDEPGVGEGEGAPFVAIFEADEDEEEA